MCFPGGVWGGAKRSHGPTAPVANSHFLWLRGSKWARALPGQKVSLPNGPYSVKKGVWVKAQMSAARVTMQPRVVATTS